MWKLRLESGWTGCGKPPLVHCISNLVTANDCANVVLAAGASPIMADAPEEVRGDHGPEPGALPEPWHPEPPQGRRHVLGGAQGR